uniref:Uncharacterized protein n=1 Tax=Rhizophora mucronata TaxID=61149 RepID=A0A2P2LX32_RHIMU
MELNLAPFYIYYEMGFSGFLLYVFHGIGKISLAVLLSVMNGLLNVGDCTFCLNWEEENVVQEGEWSVSDVLMPGACDCWVQIPSTEKPNNLGCPMTANFSQHCMRIIFGFGVENNRMDLCGIHEI